MPDIFNRRKRSQVMSTIRGTGNRDTELRLIPWLRAHRLTGWRVLRIWEHALTKAHAAARLRRLRVTG